MKQYPTFICFVVSALCFFILWLTRPASAAGPEFISRECVAFDRSRPFMDTHKAFDKKNRVYTIVMTGNYVISQRKEIKKIRAKVGDTLRDIDWVTGEWCGVFYELAQKQIEGETE